jgi:hypothetical protein
MVQQEEGQFGSVSKELVTSIRGDLKLKHWAGNVRNSSAKITLRRRPGFMAHQFRLKDYAVWVRVGAGSLDSQTKICSLRVLEQGIGHGQTLLKRWPVSHM